MSQPSDYAKKRRTYQISDDVRRAVLRKWYAGNPIVDIASRFSVSVDWVRRAVRRHESDAGSA